MSQMLPFRLLRDKFEAKAEACSCRMHRDSLGTVAVEPCQVHEAASTMLEMLKGIAADSDWKKKVSSTERWKALQEFIDRLNA